MSTFTEVPVVEVNLSNYRELWPALIHAIQSSNVISIDTELSGLGNRKKINSKDIDERYKAIAEVAKTRSIISLGISCYKLSIAVANDEQSTKSVRVLAQTFNILVLCSEDYIVEPLAVKFLVNHGFDFNKQYTQGLPYRRGNDKSGVAYHSLRQIFNEIVQSNVPVVLHNALIDLAFLYESFYASLPSNFSSFLADLSQIFSAGIYDTKYIVEYVSRMPASFLEYAFRKCLRDNSSRASKNCDNIELSFLPYHSTVMEHVVLLPCGLNDKPSERDMGKEFICQHYANYGWCASGFNCTESHDVDLILDSQEWLIEQKKKKKLEKKAANEQKEKGEESLMDVEESCEKLVFDGKVSSGEELNGNNRVVGHRAGFDAFMTGYIFLFHALTESFIKEEVLHPSADTINKVYLCGKDFPLQIIQSNFAKFSKQHTEKWAKLKGIENGEHQE